MGANLGNWAMPIFYVLLLCWQPPKGSPLIVQSCTDLGATLGSRLTMVEALCHGVATSMEEAQSVGLSGGGMGVRGLLHRNPQFLYLHHSSDGTVKAQNSMQLPSPDCSH